MKQLQIAIDGPASSGKSTIAQEVAKQLELVYIDTGAMYRALTYEALRKGVSLNNEEMLLKLLSQTKIRFVPKLNGQKVYINGQDVTLEIRNSEVSRNVSVVSAHPKVREQLVKMQQDLAGQHSVIMDGRDIGTVVLPNATVKIFLVASVEERAKRRQLENEVRGIPTTYEEIKRDLIRRDEIDSNREHSPLKKANDALEVDTTHLSIVEVVQEILNIVDEKLNNDKVC